MHNLLIGLQTLKLNAIPFQ